jgi:hypothetical protein
MNRLRSALLLSAASLSGCAALSGERAPVPMEPVRGLAGAAVEAGHAAQGQRVATLWRRAQAHVTAALGQPFRRPVRLRICATARCMKALARDPRRDAESSRDGLLLGPGAFRPGLNLESLLAHELVHALFRQYLARRYWRVPAWFHEGVAVTVSGNGAEGVSAAAARQAMRSGDRFTFYCRRDRLGFNRAFRPGGQLYYRQAELFVRHIAGAEAQFHRLIERTLRTADLCASWQHIRQRPLRREWRRFRTGQR